MSKKETRKGTAAEAKAMQDKQARATLRKLVKRLPNTNFESKMWHFLRGCISDVEHSAGA